LKIRSTEKPHSFSEKLFKAVRIYDLQGLTLDSNNNFTAGIEAVEFEADEIIDITNLFSIDSWKAKWALCYHLSLPFYVIAYKYQNDFLDIYEISVDLDVINIEYTKRLKTTKFPNWWAELKGTKQSKKLYEARGRISFYDYILKQYGLAWGGNIDGFTLNSNMSPQAIIETRYTTKTPLEDYDPAIFFSPHYTRKGDYMTWKPLILLASKLKIPLFLITFERNSTIERIGFSVIDSITNEDLNYQNNNPPNKNIIIGIENIKKQIKAMISKKPPNIY
jgi:hypothetical protein